VVGREAVAVGAPAGRGGAGARRRR
jgi:hypothetical protein